MENRIYFMCVCVYVLVNLYILYTFVQFICTIVNHM